MYRAIPFADLAMSTGQGWKVEGPDGLMGEVADGLVQGGLTMSRRKAEEWAEKLNKEKEK